MPQDAALPMPPAFLREELDEEHEASYFAESDKILSFAFKSIVSPEYIVSLNADFGKIWAGIGERERAYPLWISSLIFYSFQLFCANRTQKKKSEHILIYVLTHGIIINSFY